MKFFLGVIIGATISKPILFAVDKKFGKMIRPKISEIAYQLHVRVLPD